ncbi:MAG: hypothetical protein U1F50_18720 [Rubrivivax sp.]
MLSFLARRAELRREADEMVEHLCRALPASQQERLQGATLPPRAAAAVRQVAASAARVARARAAGALSRAYLLNRVRWGLRERGYGEAFVETLIAGLVVAVGAAPKG